MDERVKPEPGDLVTYKEHASAFAGTPLIGHLVALCVHRGCKRLADLPDDAFARAHPKLGPGVKDVLGVANAVKAFRSYGSTAPSEVARQLQGWKERLGGTFSSSPARPPVRSSCWTR